MSRGSSNGERVDPEAAPDEQSGLLEQLERTLMGERRYTRLDVAERAGVPIERAERLWRALGFAGVPDDEVVFTDNDVAALQTIANLVRLGVVDESAEVALSRSLGQTLARLAEWQTAVVRDVVAEPDMPLKAQPGMVSAAEALLPIMERLQSHVWRRHLVAAAGRILALPPDSGASATVVVGFADIVSFTKLSRDIDDAGLAELLERFEGTASAVIAEGRGRVIKTLGDEVMFVADTPHAGADIALGLVERIHAAADLPELRTGLAYGPVLHRLGDVYGPVVNVAARLTSLARPGTVLVDRELASALADQSRYALRKLRRVSVRGYRRLEPWALRVA